MNKYLAKVAQSNSLSGDRGSPIVQKSEKDRKRILRTIGSALVGAGAGLVTANAISNIRGFVADQHFNKHVLPKLRGSVAEKLDVGRRAIDDAMYIPKRTKAGLALGGAATFGGLHAYKEYKDYVKNK